ncbi:tripartite tricarboxylate transporter substrate binding protein [soil metagenome]
MSMVPRRRHLVAAMAAAPAAFALAPCRAQGNAYPNRPIRMMLGFAPGGPTDNVARILGQRMSEQFGQPVIIDNRPGAGGNIAAETVAKAPADGYTIIYKTAAIAISPWVFDKVNFDPLRDFTPIAMTADSPLVLLVNPGVAANTPAELITLIRANPGKCNYSTSGVGTIEHLTSAQFASIHQLQVSHVPYKGTAPALIDLIAGQVQFQMTPQSTVIPYVRDGWLRALGVTSRERSKALPDVPTISESLNSEFLASAWHGLLAPAATPRPIVAALNRFVNVALADPAVVRKLADQGSDAVGGTEDKYGRFLASELARWESVVKQTGAKAQ